jgi:hypothetical protein
MKLKVSRVDVWAATLKDRPGGLAGALTAAAKAGADLDFVIARRRPEKRGEGVVFLTPIAGAAQVKAAKAAGFAKADGLHSLRIQGRNKPGVGAKIARELAAARINLRGFSAAALDKRFVVYLALDTAAAAAKAVRVLKAM